MKTLRAPIIEHPFFLGLKPDQLEILLGCASEAKFQADQVLFREGEPASRFYLVGSGRVAIEARQPANATALVQTLGPGDVLGWSWLFSPFTWHFQARALAPTQAIVLDGARRLVKAENNPEFGYALMKRVAQVVIHRRQAARQPLIEQQIESAMDG